MPARLFLLVLIFSCARPARAVGPNDFDVILRRGGLANTFARLRQGQPVRIAYLGGSVTQMDGWRNHVTSWFSARYPGLITEVNAGWPGTGSAIGALRMQRDVLVHQPNLIFIEFAINDETGDPLNFTMRNYDGMVRQAWAQNRSIDLCFIEVFATYIEPPYLEGRLPTTVDAHYRIADHYAIPSVNVGWALYQRVLAGTPLSSLLPDGAHPNATGHQVYADAIFPLLESERAAAATATPHPLPVPKTDYPILGSSLVALGDITLPSGWTRGTGFGVSSFAQSSQQGAEITRTFSGPIAVLTFIRNPDGGQVGYSINGSAFTGINLYHDSAWLYAIPIGKTLATSGTHSVRLRVLSTSGVVRLVQFESAVPYTPVSGEEVFLECRDAAGNLNTAYYEELGSNEWYAPGSTAKSAAPGLVGSGSRFSTNATLGAAFRFYPSRLPGFDNSKGYAVYVTVPNVSSAAAEQARFTINTAGGSGDQSGTIALTRANCGDTWALVAAYARFAANGYVEFAENGTQSNRFYADAIRLVVSIQPTPTPTPPLRPLLEGR